MIRRGEWTTPTPSALTPGAVREPRDLTDAELRVAALTEALYGPRGRLGDPLPPAIAEAVRRNVARAGGGEVGEVRWRKRAPRGR